MENSKGKIFYGLHFYPGVAEYQEPGQEPYRVFLNEDTLRQMDPSFAGRPVFVMHVDGVDSSLDNLRGDADGWVVESFFNSNDGKHWVKFLVCSEKGEEAVRRGWQLSNCYIPKTFSKGGLWNGVAYAKEITGGEYEHLAIVPNPRYEESVIMSPEEFKKYNDDKVVELKRLSNQGKDSGMKLNFFKKTKVENAVDLESMTVVLPKTGKEMTITQLVNEADEKEEKKDMNAGMADPAHKVKMFDGSYCNVGELVEKHKALHDELEGMKGKKEDGEDQDMEYAEKEAIGNEEDEKVKEDKKNEEDEKAKADADKEKEVKDAKKKNDKEKAERLRNAPVAALTKVAPARIELASDKVMRGKQLFGSN